MHVETTLKSLEELNSRIDSLQEKVLLGILRLDKADKALKEIRTGLIELRQMIQEEFALNPASEEDPSSGPDAA